MGRSELAGEGRLGTYAKRHANRDEVDRMVGEWSATFTRDELLRRCDEAQVPCGMVCAIDEIFDDPQYAARENILRVDDPRVGEVAVPNVVPRLTDTPGAVRWLGRPDRRRQRRHPHHAARQERRRHRRAQGQGRGVAAGRVSLGAPIGRSASRIKSSPGP